jgi:hypothetical protein
MHMSRRLEIKPSQLWRSVLILSAPEGYFDVPAGRVPNMDSLTGTHRIENIPVVPFMVDSYMGNCKADTCH